MSRKYILAIVLPMFRIAGGDLGLRSKYTLFRYCWAGSSDEVVGSGFRRASSVRGKGQKSKTSRQRGITIGLTGD